MTNNSDYVEYEDTVMRIEGNAFTFQGYVFQISSISRIWRSTITPAKESFGLWPFVCIMLGLFLMNHLPFWGFILLIAGIVRIFYVVTENGKIETLYAFNMEFNSIKRYAFLSKDTKFVDEVFSIVNRIIKEGNKAYHFTLDFSRNELVDNSTHEIVYGTNIKDSTVNNSTINNTTNVNNDNNQNSKKYHEIH